MQHVTWKDTLSFEKNKDYFQSLMQFLAAERHSGKTIYPQKSQVFNALKYTPLASVKVVIVGQDPYHNPNQAHGLCFSVLPGSPQPPSLRNIFLALHHDLGISNPGHGCLIDWAKQGVLLLNTVLTVQAHKPQSHAGKGWETFTTRVIQVVDHYRSGVVFLLWGAQAQQKAAMIDATKHRILTSSHPSPLSAHRGFLTCTHFSQTNHYLCAQGQTPIDWQLKDINHP